MDAIPYLSGVVHGDGWCGQALGLRVNDQDFAQAFATAIHQAFGVVTTPKQDERGYWLTRTTNKDGRYNHLLTFEPTTPEEYAAWVRGLFDSEGNAQLRLNGTTLHSFGRRVAIYSTNYATLERASRYLSSLALPTYLRGTKNSVGHKGTRIVYELTLAASQLNYARFASAVGSNIARKQTILDAIPGSYRPDRRAHCQAAQLEGARAKHTKTMTITLPAVVEGVRELIRQGVKPTQRACRIIPGYDSIQRHVPQNELIAMALKEE